MAEQKNAPAATTEYDAKEVSRVLGKIRVELSNLVRDANRKIPFFAKSKEEAAAKRDAAFRVLNEFAARLDALKQE